MTRSQSYGIDDMCVVAKTAAQADLTREQLLATTPAELLTLLRIRRGIAEVTCVRHLIDTDGEPSKPSKESSIERHCKGGVFEWDADKVGLWTMHGNGAPHPSRVPGSLFYQQAIEQRAFNANVLDYLLSHPRLIPESFKNMGPTGYVYFLGTTYRDAGGVFVRSLRWTGSDWDSLKWYLDNTDWGDLKVLVPAY